MILVTGATGTVGSHVVRDLASRGAPTRALVRSPEKAAALEALGVEVAVADLRDLGSALDGVERLFLNSTPAPDEVDLQTGAIDQARAAGVQHVVKLAAIGYDQPDPPVRFAVDHARIAEHLRASGMAWTILAPNDFFQNLLGQAETISQGVLASSFADARVSSIDVADIAAVAGRILSEGSHRGASLDLTGPEALNRDEVAAALSDATGHPVEVVRVSDEDVQGALLGAGFPEWNVGGLLELFAVYRAGYGASTTPVVEETLGRPAKRLADWARENAAAFARS